MLSVQYSCSMHLLMVKSKDKKKFSTNKFCYGGTSAGCYGGTLPGCYGSKLISILC